MAAPAIQLYDATDTTVITSLAFGTVAPGTPTAAQPVNVWNDNGGVLGSDDANGVIVRVLARVTGSGAAPVASGLEILDRNGVEVRVVGVSSGVNGSTTPWQAAGATAFPVLPNIPSDEKVELEVRCNLPVAAEGVQVDLFIRVERTRSEYVGDDGLGDGLELGLGDPARQDVLRLSGPIAPAGSPDDTVTLPDVAWLHQGNVHALLTSVVTLDDEDVNTDTLATDEAYFAVYTLGDGVVTETKGVKNDAPLTVDDRPTPPAGERVLGWVERNFDGVIESTDITMAVEQPDGFGTNDTSLTPSFGPGVARIAGYRVRTTVPSAVTLSPNDETWVWALQDGTLAQTDTAAPPDTDARALPLWKVTTDGSGITALEDLRDFYDALSVPVSLHWTGAEAAEYRAWANPFGAPLFLRPVAGAMRLEAWEVADTGGGGAVDDLQVDIELYDGAGTWTSLFTSSGSDDRRPTVDVEAGPTLDTAAMPEVLEVPPGGILRAALSSTPSNVANVDGWSLSFILEPRR